MKKRLLKDLPFEQLKAGDVLTKANGTYHIDLGDTIYEAGGSSSNGWLVVNGTPVEIIDLIWDDPAWFQDATANHLVLKAYRNKIEIKFASLDLADAQTLAKGIQACLIRHFGTEEQTMTWHKFKGFTVHVR